MTDKFNTLSQELETLEQKRNHIISEMKEIAIEMIKEVAKENPHISRRLSKHSFTIMSSGLTGWSPMTYDWEASIDTVLAYLDKYSVQEWKDALIRKVKNTSGISNVMFKEKVLTSYGWKKEVNYAIDREFLEKIIKKF